MSTGIPPEVNELPGVHRIENYSKEEMTGLAMEMTHAVYPHDAMFSEFCTVQSYVDCPPEKAYEYLADVFTLQEWTYSLRDFTPPDSTGLVVATDKIGSATKIYIRVVAHREAGTVDFHCAWDQGDELWMIYLMRVIPAQPVFKKPGSAILWTNCRHPYYLQNPFPEKGPPGRKVWVGDMWPFFYAGHAIELENLKQLLEYRHQNGLPMTIGGPA